MTTRGLLLVEFTTVDRLHCAISFPYINGVARAAGLQTRWLRFAMKAAATMGQRVGVPLEEDDLAALAAAADELAPGWVLFGHRPADAVARTVAAGDDRRLAYLGGFDEGDDRGPCRRLNEGGVASWLGLEPLAGRLPEEAGADYGWEPGNALAAEARPLPFLVCGPECLYTSPVAKNPAYEGVDLSGCVNLDGCAFCRSERGAASWDVPPLELARRNLEAASRTHPTWRHRPRYRLTGEQVFARVDQLAELVLELSLEPCDLLLDARADRVVRAAERLERAAARLAGTGHMIHVCLVGLENFSPPELRRMNKGVTATRLVQAVDLLLGLEGPGADSFSLGEYGGFSTILYTPWTTPDDLWLNLEVVKLFGLERLCGKLLTSRLRLYPELPLARLARRDGLLLEGGYDDPALDTARRNFYPGELPWRFADPAVELVNRVTTRLNVDDALAGDALYARVQAWLGGLLSADALDAARSLVAALRARDDHGISTVEQLLEAAEDVAGGRRRPIHTVTGAESMATDGILMQQKWTPASAMMRLGLKPVRKEEPLTRQQVEALEHDEAASCLPNLCFRQRRRTRGGEPVFEMFFGEDAALVQETCRLSDQLEDPERYLDEKAALAGRIGVLLGYPACCAEAFAREPLAGWERNEWVHLSRRLAHAGPLPPEMNPFQHLFFVPCAADCDAALELVLRIMEDRRQQPETAPERWDEEARLPVLFLLNRPGQFVPLHPLEPPTEDRIRYRAERRAGDDPRLEAVLRGDTLEVDEGRVAVLRRGELIQTFALEAAVWWHERTFHPDFWRPVVERLLQSGQAPEVRTPEEASTSPDTSRFLGELEDWAGPEQLIHAVATAWTLAGASRPPPEVVLNEVVRGDDTTSRLTLTLADLCLVVRLEGRRLADRVHYELWCEPHGRAPARPLVRLVRGLADLLDSRTRPAALTALEQGRAAGVSPLRHRAERAALQLSATPRLPDVTVPWPTAGDGAKVQLSLRDGQRWVDLYLEPRRADGRHYLAAGETSISHFADTEMDPRAQRLVQILGRVLERLG